MAHIHKCQCGAEVKCSATLERNYDGWPEAVCRRVMENQTIFCEECEEHGVCEECGAETAGDEQFPFLGKACADTKRENDDGEPQSDIEHWTDSIDPADRCPGGCRKSYDIKGLYVTTATGDGEQRCMTCGGTGKALSTGDALRAIEDSFNTPRRG